MRTEALPRAQGKLTFATEPSGELVAKLADVAGSAPASLQRISGKDEGGLSKGGFLNNR